MHNQKIIGSVLLRRPLAPLGNGTTRICARLLIGPLQISRSPLQPSWTGGLHILAVAETKSEVG